MIMGLVILAHFKFGPIEESSVTINSKIWWFGESQKGFGGESGGVTNRPQKERPDERISVVDFGDPRAVGSKANGRRGGLSVAAAFPRSFPCSQSARNREGVRAISIRISLRLVRTSLLERLIWTHRPPSLFFSSPPAAGSRGGIAASPEEEEWKWRGWRWWLIPPRFSSLPYLPPWAMDPRGPMLSSFSTRASLSSRPPCGSTVGPERIPSSWHLSTQPPRSDETETTLSWFLFGCVSFSLLLVSSVLISFCCAHASAYMAGGCSFSAAQLRICADGGANRLHDEMPAMFPHEDPFSVRKRLNFQFSFINFFFPKLLERLCQKCGAALLRWSLILLLILKCYDEKYTINLPFLIWGLVQSFSMDSPSRCFDLVMLFIEPEKRSGIMLSFRSN